MIKEAVSFPQPVKTFPIYIDRHPFTLTPINSIYQQIATQRPRINPHQFSELPLHSLEGVGTKRLHLKRVEVTFRLATPNRHVPLAQGAELFFVGGQEEDPHQAVRGADAAGLSATDVSVGANNHGFTAGLFIGLRHRFIDNPRQFLELIGLGDGR